MRNWVVLAAVLGSISLAGCGSEPAPGPVEQIVVREPGTPAQTVALPSREAGAAPIPSAVGEQAFAMCTGCHIAEDGAASMAGPNLYGVVGRGAGALEDFDYSEALSQSGIVWDTAQLDRFLADPTAAVPGTYMAAGAVPDAGRRAAIIAYLETLGE